MDSVILPLNMQKALLLTLKHHTYLKEKEGKRENPISKDMRGNGDPSGSSENAQILLTFADCCQPL